VAILSRAEKVFIDGIGVAAATSGVLTQAQGRLFAFVYLRQAPVDLEEIAESLQIAKSSVSVNMKPLLEWQLVRRVAVPGSRKDHYEGASDFWRVLQEIVERRFRWNLRQVIATVEETKRALEESSYSDQIRAKVEALEQFASAVESGMAAFSSGKTWEPDEARRAGAVVSIHSRRARDQQSRPNKEVSGK